MGFPARTSYTFLVRAHWVDLIYIKSVGMPCGVNPLSARQGDARFLRVDEARGGYSCAPHAVHHMRVVYHLSGIVFLLGKRLHVRHLTSNR